MKIISGKTVFASLVFLLIMSFVANNLLNDDDFFRDKDKYKKSSRNPDKIIGVEIRQQNRQGEGLAALRAKREADAANSILAQADQLAQAEQIAQTTPAATQPIPTVPTAESLLTEEERASTRATKWKKSEKMNPAWKEFLQTIRCEPLEQHEFT